MTPIRDDRDSRPSMRLTRRGVLVLGGLGALGLAGVGYGAQTLGYLNIGGRGTMTPESLTRPVEVGRDELTARTTIGPATHVYEVDAKPAKYRATDAFVTRLERWLAAYGAVTGAEVDEVRSYGAWVPGDRLWHSAGAAIDVARLRNHGKDVVSARYDVWRDDTAAVVRRNLHAYWRLAASLHTEFADVLTYLYDANHVNHIHVDTGRFGPDGAPRLIRRSGVQVTAVQAMLTHVWGVTGIETSGELDSATRDAAARVLRDAGSDYDVVDGVEGWSAFMTATAARA